MRKLPLLLVVLTLIAVSCGSGGDETVTAAPDSADVGSARAERQSDDDPDSVPPPEDGTETESGTEISTTTTVAPTTTAPDSSTTLPPTTTAPTPTTTILLGGPCDDLRAIFVGPDVLVDQTNDIVVERLKRVVSAFDAEAAAGLDVLSDSADGNDVIAVFGLLDRIDVLTDEACGIPLFSAATAMPPTNPVQVFCTVASDLGDGTLAGDDCSDQQTWVAPDSFPCFLDTEASWVVGQSERFVAVDCDSGQLIEWDGYSGMWGEPSGDNFIEIDSEIRPG